jgi:hypothetical protein
MRRELTAKGCPKPAASPAGNEKYRRKTHRNFYNPN